MTNCRGREQVKYAPACISQGTRALSIAAEFAARISDTLRVGPMTVALLMHNTVKAHRQNTAPAR